jgi:quercetin dioxygenase-like cupin family protein
MARLTKKSASRKNRKPAKIVHRGQAKHHVWTKIELETLNPLLQRQLVTGSNVMLARILLKKGCIVPLHSHHNEQLSYVIEGALKFTIRGKNTWVRTGEVLTIPPHVPHLVKAMRDTVSLDIFHPPRMDWINKTDSYLRR